MPYFPPAGGGGGGQTTYDYVIDINGGADFTDIQTFLNSGLADNTSTFVRKGQYVTVGQTITNANTDVTFVGDGPSNTIWVLVTSSLTQNGVNMRFRDMTIVLFDAFGASEFISNDAISFQNCSIVVLADTSYFEFNGSQTASFINTVLVTEGSDGINSQFRINVPTNIQGSNFILGNDNSSDIANNVLFSSNFNSVVQSGVILNSNVFSSLVDAPIKFTGNENLIRGCGFITAFATPGATGAMLSILGNDNLVCDGIFNNTSLFETTAIFIGSSGARNKISGNEFKWNATAVYCASDGFQTLVSDNSCYTVGPLVGMFAIFDSPTTPHFAAVISNNVVEGDVSAGSTLIELVNPENTVVQGNSLAGVDDGIVIGASATGTRVYGNFIDCTNPVTNNGTNSFINDELIKIYDAIVAPSGGDYTTLGAALAAASNGDTIFVRSGTYNEAAITNSLNDITIIGESKEATIINVPASANIQLNGTGVTITNLKVQVNNAASSYFSLNGANSVAYGCHFSTTRNSGPTFGFSGGEAIIANNTFTTTNSHQFGDFISLGYGALFTNNYLNLDDGNENTNSGIVVASSGGNVTISNNIFDVYQETANVQDCAYIYLNSSNCVVSNNKIWYRQSGGRGVGVKANNSDGHTITGNNFNNVFKGVQLRVGNTLVASNTITLSQASTNVAIGIHQSQANQQYNIFNDNLIYGGSTYYKGIDVANGSEDFQISNNTIRWCADGAITLGTTVRAKVTDNIIWQTSTVTLDKYLNDGGTATHARGNGVPTTEEKNQVTMKNVSGGSLAAGDLVVLNNVANGTEVTTTTTAGDSKVFGVASESIANNEFGKIQTLGKVTTLQADGTAAIVIGDFLTSFTTAKTAALATAGDTAIAIALEDLPSGTGQLDALIINPRLI